MNRKINLKQPKYIIPLILLPFVLLMGHFISGFADGMKKNGADELGTSREISADMGTGGHAEIKSKADAYREFFDKRTDGRTMIEGFEQETDSMAVFEDNLSEEEKRHIDSLDYARQRNRLKGLSNQAKRQQESHAREAGARKAKRKQEDEQYERSLKMLEMLNRTDEKRESGKAPERETDWRNDQMSLMREQMMFMDSLEKAKNPELRAQAEAHEVLKKNQEELELFLNSTLKVSKAPRDEEFNSIHREREGSFITAVIDENIKGYLGSRIRIRLLEDIYVGTLRIGKGTAMYALISGFALQRVNLNIVSVMYQNEILPINLNIYDVDGMEGLYVPASAFREMTRTMGQNVVQGQNMNLANGGFFENALTSIFNSTSRTVADLIRKNKVKVKYNSIVYLIDGKELAKKKKNIYKQNDK